MTVPIRLCFKHKCTYKWNTLFLFFPQNHLFTLQLKYMRDGVGKTFIFNTFFYLYIRTENQLIYGQTRGSCLIWSMNMKNEFI